MTMFVDDFDEQQFLFHLEGAMGQPFDKPDFPLLPPLLAHGPVIPVPIQPFTTVGQEQMNMKRLKLLLLLSTMPSEAFGWIVVALSRSIFPAGTGGFRPESRESIEAVKKEAEHLMSLGEDV